MGSDHHTECDGHAGAEAPADRLCLQVENLCYVFALPRSGMKLIPPLFAMRFAGGASLCGVALLRQPKNAHFFRGVFWGGDCWICVRE